MPVESQAAVDLNFTTEWHGNSWVESVPLSCSVPLQRNKITINGHKVGITMDVGIVSDVKCHDRAGEKLQWVDSEHMLWGMCMAPWPAMSVAFFLPRKRRSTKTRHSPISSRQNLSSKGFFFFVLINFLSSILNYAQMVKWCRMRKER